MPLLTESRAIGASTYEVTQMGALQGRKVLTRLLKIVGPAYAMVSTKGVEAALSEVVTNLSEDDTEYFCAAFEPLTTVTVGDKKPRLSGIADIHFAGDYMSLIEWLVFCFEVNFSSFFRDLKSAVGRSPASGTP